MQESEIECLMGMLFQSQLFLLIQERHQALPVPEIITQNQTHIYTSLRSTQRMFPEAQGD